MTYNYRFHSITEIFDYTEIMLLIIAFYAIIFYLSFKYDQIQSNKAISEWLQTHKVQLDDGICSLCLDEFATQETCTLSCNHGFHIKCITKWLIRKQECPLCRKKFYDLQNKVRHLQHYYNEYNILL